MPGRGRPSIRTPEIEDDILQRLAAGETLRSICRTEGYPAVPTVVDWTNQDPAFSDLYARARSKGLDAIAEEIIEISDDGTNDFMDRQSASGIQRCLDAENVNRSRLRVDARKWLLSKMRPDKYGEHQAVTIDAKVEISGRETLQKELDERRKRRLST